MSFDVKTTPRFEKDIKRLVKKYPSLKTEYFDLVKELQQRPDLGSPIGNNCYKI